MNAPLLLTLNGLVLTAGIGEHQPDVRASICGHLRWLGIDINARLNADNARVISSNESPVTVLVLATDEECVIARETMSVLYRSAGPELALESTGSGATGSNA
jgi:acetate kinase